MRRQIAFVFLSLALTGCGRNPPPAPTLSAVDRNNLAVFLMEHERGDFPAAIDVLKRLTAERPGYALAWVNLGIAHVANSPYNAPNKYQEALVALDRAERLGGRWPQLYFARGWTRMNVSDYRGAELEFRAVLHIDPRDAFTHYHLGRAFQMQGRLREAAAEFRTAVRLSPRFQSAWAGLAQCEVRSGHSAAATHAFRKMARLLETHTGIAASGNVWFEGLGRYIEPLMDSERAPVNPAETGDNTNPWIRLDLRLGDETNTGVHPPAGPGVTVELWNGSTRQVIKTGDEAPKLDLGPPPRPKWLRITWPDGTRQCEAIASDTLTKWRVDDRSIQFLDPNSTVVVKEAERRPAW